MTRAALLLCMASLALAAPAAGQDLAIRAGRVVVSADKVIPNGIVLITKGKVVQVGKKVDLPKGVQLIERPRAWIVPGFVDLSTGLGLRGDRDETTDSVAPDVTTATRIDPRHRDFAAARAAGITTCLITPGDRNLFGGRATILKTTGATIKGTVVKLALGSSTLRRNRTPTSRGGALALLRSTLQDNHAKQGAGILESFSRGELPALCTVEVQADLRALLGVAKKYGLQAIVRFNPKTTGPKLFEGLEERLAGQHVAVGPFTLRTPAEARKVPALLAKAKAQPVFVSEAPTQPASGLRLTAVLAVRAGLAAKTAFRGITANAAAAIKIGHRIGTLEPGKDADLVVLDGPPLRLDSRVLEVFVEGRRVYQRPAPKKKEG